MTRYRYEARILPIGTPVVIPDLSGGRREQITFTADHFKLERESRNPAKVLLDHDRLKQIGKVQTLRRYHDWFVADFLLDAGLTSVLPVGTPISVGLSMFESGGTYLSEVSVVRHGAVEGAKIIRRHRLEETPPGSTPKLTELEFHRRRRQWKENRARLVALGFDVTNYREPPRPHPSEMEPAAVAGEAFHSPPGTVIRRPGIGQVISVR